jgi:glycosyltransferase involved in cell wall biosynthesis
MVANLKTAEALQVTGQEFSTDRVAAPARPLHYCFINPPLEYYSPVCGGAVATIYMEQVRELIARGHKASVLSIVNDDPIYPNGDFVPIHSAGFDKFSFVHRKWVGLVHRVRHWDWPRYEYYLRSYSKALKTLSPAPDVVVVTNDWHAPRFIKKVLPNTKVIVWLQNEVRTQQKSLERQLPHIHAIVAVSDYIAGWTAKHHKISLDRIKTISNAVNLERFHPADGFLEPKKEVKVLFIGRIDPNKGPDIVADAVAVLKKEGLPVQLTVAGGLWWYGHGNEMADPFFRKLKVKMDAAGANYVGHVTRPNVPELIRTHDITCVLSRSNEPNALVVLEAMASGCAVIASNRGGLPQSAGGTGILVDPDDFESVVKALRALVADPALLREYKEKAIQRAALGSWNRNVNQLEQAVAAPSPQ